MKPLIHKRGKTSWQVSFTHGGRRYRHSFRLARLASQWANACEAAVLEGRPLPSPTAPRAQTETLANLLQRAYARHWQGGPSEPTQRSAMACISASFGPCNAADITTLDVVSVVTEWRNKDGLSPATINRYLSCLRVALTLGAKLGCVGKLPDIEHVPVPVKDRRIYLRHSEIELLGDTFNAKGRKQAWYWMKLAVETGMRPAELERVRWRHITFDGNMTPLAVDVPVVKTAHQRRLPLSEAAAAAVAALHNQFVWSDLDDSNKFIFTTEAGRYTARSFSDDWAVARKALHKECEPDWVPYILRHTFISRLVLGGVSLPAVQQAAGHNKIQTTMRYVHLQPLGAVEIQAALQGDY